MRLLCDENIVGLEALDGLCELRVASGRDITRETLGDAEALWVRSVTRIDADLLEGSSVRVVGTATAGTEHVDISYLKANGIAFHAAPGANANSVVEYVLAALAALRAPWECLDAGGPLGIVGFGHVGRLLWQVASDLGWRAIVCDPWVERGEHGDNGESDDPRPEFASIDALLDCDVLSVHCALTDRQPWPSRFLFDAPRLQRMRAGQWLINAARGEIVDGSALLARLNAPEPPAIVLDVWEHEPAIDTRLLRSPAVALATAHIAGYSWDAKWAATCMLAEATFGIAAKELPRPQMSDEPLMRVKAKDPVQLAHGLISQRYDILADDRRLRASALPLDGIARGQAFDRLRKEYPLRRELRDSLLITSQEGAALRTSGVPTERSAARYAVGAADTEGTVVKRGTGLNSEQVLNSEATRVLNALGVLERETGFEPATSTLARLRSTN